MHGGRNGGRRDNVVRCLTGWSPRIGVVHCILREYAIRKTSNQCSLSSDGRVDTQVVVNFRLTNVDQSLIGGLEQSFLVGLVHCVGILWVVHSKLFTKN